MHGKTQSYLRHLARQTNEKRRFSPVRPIKNGLRSRTGHIGFTARQAVGRQRFLHVLGGSPVYFFVCALPVLPTNAIFTNNRDERCSYWTVREAKKSDRNCELHTAWTFDNDISKTASLFSLLQAACHMASSSLIGWEVPSRYDEKQSRSLKRKKVCKFREAKKWDHRRRTKSRASLALSTIVKHHRHHKRIQNIYNQKGFSFLSTSIPNLMSFVHCEPSYGNFCKTPPGSTGKVNVFSEVCA